MSPEESAQIGEGVCRASVKTWVLSSSPLAGSFPLFLQGSLCPVQLLQSGSLSQLHSFAPFRVCLGAWEQVVQGSVSLAVSCSAQVQRHWHMAHRGPVNASLTVKQLWEKLGACGARRLPGPLLLCKHLVSPAHCPGISRP